MRPDESQGEPARESESGQEPGAGKSRREPVRASESQQEALPCSFFACRKKIQCFTHLIGDRPNNRSALLQHQAAFTLKVHMQFHHMERDRASRRILSEVVRVQHPELRTFLPITVGGVLGW